LLAGQITEQPGDDSREHRLSQFLRAFGVAAAENDPETSRADGAEKEERENRQLLFAPELGRGFEPLHLLFMQQLSHRLFAFSDDYGVADLVDWRGWRC
jgi:hypothetical protein